MSARHSLGCETKVAAFQASLRDAARFGNRDPWVETHGYDRSSLRDVSIRNVSLVAERPIDGSRGFQPTDPDSQNVPRRGVTLEMLRP